MRVIGECVDKRRGLWYYGCMLENEKSSVWRHNLRRNWKDLLTEFQQNPLGFLVFATMVAIVAITGTDGITDAALFVAAGAAGFFAYRRAKAVEQGMKDADNSRADERFSRSCAMLGRDKSESVQIGGLISLDNLARGRKDEYRAEAFNVVCAFVRDNYNHLRSRQYAIDVFFKKQSQDADYFYAELSADLRTGDFYEMDFTDNVLDNADFNKARVISSLLERAKSMKGAKIPKNVYHTLRTKHNDIVEGEDP